MSKKTWLLVASSVLATFPIISYITINTAHKNNIDNSNIDKQYQALSNDKNIAYFYASDLKEIAELISVDNKVYNQENFNLAKTKIAKLLTLKTLIDKESNNQLEWNTNNISLLSKYYNNEYESTKKELLDKETGYYEALSNNDRQKLNKYVSSANRLAGEDKVFYRNLVINYFKDNQESLERFKALQAEIKSLKDTILMHLATFDTNSNYYQKIIKSLENNYNKTFLEGLKTDVLSKNELKTNLDNVNYNISINPKYSNELEYWYNAALSTYKITDIAKLLVLPIKDINNFKSLKLVIKAKDEVFSDNQLKQEYYLENNVESDFYVSIEYEIANEELNLKYPLRKKLYPLVYSYLQNNNDYFEFKKNYKPFWDTLHINDTETKHIMFVNTKPYLKNLFFTNVYSNIKSKWKSLVDTEKNKGIKYKSDTLINSYASNSEYQPIRDYFNDTYDSFYAKDPSLSEDLFWTYQQYLTNKKRNKQLSTYLQDFKDILASKNDFEVKNQSLISDLKLKLSQVSESNYQLPITNNEDSALISSLENYFGAFSLTINYKDNGSIKGMYNTEHLFNNYIVEFYKKLVVSYNTDNSAYLSSLTNFLSAYKKLVKAYETNTSSSNSDLNEFYRPFLAKYLFVDYSNKDNAAKVLEKYYSNEIFYDDIVKRIDNLNAFISNYESFKNNVRTKVHSINYNSKYFKNTNYILLEQVLNHYNQKFKTLNEIDNNVFDKALLEIDNYISKYENLITKYDFYNDLETNIHFKTSLSFNNSQKDTISWTDLSEYNLNKEAIINNFNQLITTFKEKMDFNVYINDVNNTFYTNHTALNEIEAFSEKLKSIIELNNMININTLEYFPEISFDNNYPSLYTKQFFIDTLNNNISETTKASQDLINKDLINNHLKLTFKERNYNNLISNSKDSFDYSDNDLNYKVQFRVDNDLNTHYKYLLEHSDNNDIYNISKTITKTTNNSSLNINFYTIPTNNTLTIATNKIKDSILNIDSWNSLTGDEASKKNTIKEHIRRVLELEEFASLKLLMENSLDSWENINNFFTNILNIKIYAKNYFNNLSNTLNSFANNFFWLKDSDNYLILEEEFGARLRNSFSFSESDYLSFDRKYLQRHNWLTKETLIDLLTSSQNDYDRNVYQNMSHKFTNITLDDNLIRDFYQSNSLLSKNEILNNLTLDNFEVKAVAKTNSTRFNSEQSLQFRTKNFNIRNENLLKITFNSHTTNLFDLKTDNELKTLFKEALRDRNYYLEEFLTNNLFNSILKSRWNDFKNNVNDISRSTYNQTNDVFDSLFLDRNIVNRFIETVNPNNLQEREDRNNIKKPLVRLKTFSDYDNIWIRDNLLEIRDTQRQMIDLWLSNNSDFNQLTHTKNWYLYQFISKFKNDTEVKNITGKLNLKVDLNDNIRYSTRGFSGTRTPYIQAYHHYSHRNTFVNNSKTYATIGDKIFLKVLYQYHHTFTYTTPINDYARNNRSRENRLYELQPVIVPYIENREYIFNNSYLQKDGNRYFDYQQDWYINAKKVNIGDRFNISDWFRPNFFGFNNFKLVATYSNRQEGLNRFIDQGLIDPPNYIQHTLSARNDNINHWTETFKYDTYLIDVSLISEADKRNNWNWHNVSLENKLSVYNLALPQNLKGNSRKYIINGENRTNAVSDGID